MIKEIYGPLVVAISGIYRIDYEDLEDSRYPKKTVDKLNRIRPFGGKVRVVSILSKEEVEVSPVAVDNAFRTVRIPVSVLRSV